MDVAYGDKEGFQYQTVVLLLLHIHQLYAHQRRERHL